MLEVKKGRCRTRHNLFPVAQGAPQTQGQPGLTHIYALWKHPHHPATALWVLASASEIRGWQKISQLCYHTYGTKVRQDSGMIPTHALSLPTTKKEIPISLSLGGGDFGQNVAFDISAGGFWYCTIPHKNNTAKLPPKISQSSGNCANNLETTRCVTHWKHNRTLTISLI